jgi:adenine-specific DNA-methyltransferase
MAKKPLTVETLTHDEATRKNAPTAELETFLDPAIKRPIQVAYERRNPDLDPQLVWRGKDMADWSDLVVEAPPLYIQEKIHPKALIEDLKRASARADANAAPDLFADFNGVSPEARTEFYAHDQHWSNRMILGDGLKVMASLAEREGLKGQVQCIYIDPPYGIKFNSNFQWSTTSRDVKDGKADHLTREPEQVKAFRDTWRDGIHSYLTYLRDRLTVARDLLTESGSVFVQIGDENVHRVRALMDEVFGDENYVVEIIFQKTSSSTGEYVPPTVDRLLWFAKRKEALKFRPFMMEKRPGERGGTGYKNARTPFGDRRSLTKDEMSGIEALSGHEKIYFRDNITSQSMGRSKGEGAASWFPVEIDGTTVRPAITVRWKTNEAGMERLKKANRLELSSGNNLGYVRYLDDFRAYVLGDYWSDTLGQNQFGGDKTYVVQTGLTVVQRCILMTTDPGDLVLDPTCGSGTTAYVAEQWGRRWITIDTSRVALALARSRIMGARYPWYLLADSREGQMKEAEVTRTPPRDTPTHGRLRQGFVYKRVPHITLKSIANNAEIDTIWEQFQPGLEELRHKINEALGTNWQEWEMPRELNDAHRERIAENEGRDGLYPAEDGPDNWLAYWWRDRIDRQKEIDASIAAKADTEYLYDQPYPDNSRVRVAGPFTVESLSPHRVPAVDIDDSLFDQIEAAEGRAKKGASGERVDFAEMVLDNLRRSGVQQRARDDKLVFETMKLWPGEFILAEGTVRQKSLTEAEGEEATEAGPTRRAAIFVGPEYGTVSRPALTAAAREAMDAGFDLLIAAAFNFDALAGELTKMGPLTVLQARINPDLHMPDLANTGAGNLFTVFGDPDIVVHDEGDEMVSIEVLGVDMYKGGQIESGDADDIAVWFIDTDYNYESFFVRHAYFPGANDPYKALKTTLKAEIDADAWESLNRTRSRPFARPKDGRVAVKVINHFGDEVMRVLEA